MTNELVIVTNFVSRDITGLEVVGKVNDLYSSVFNQLLLMLGVVATLVVVVLPIFLSIFQRRESRLQEARLNADFSARIENAKKDLEGKITTLDEEKKAVEKALKEAEGRIEKKLSKSLAAAFHIQAFNNEERKDFAEAVKSSLVAAKYYLAADDLDNLDRVINILLASINNLNKSKIEEEELEEKLLTFEKEMAKRPDVRADKMEEYFKAKKAALKRQ
jgi:hypothetical protein